MSEDRRPVNCRFRLRDEGKAYPKSGCEACGKSIVTGLADVCTYTHGYSKDKPNGYEEKKLITDFYAQVAALNYTVNDLAEHSIEAEYKILPHSSIGRMVDIIVLQGTLKKVLRG